MSNTVATLYGRRCRLTITLPTGSFSETDPAANSITITGADDPLVPGLRIAFKISKTQQKEPNKSEIIVYNLAPANRAKLQTKGARVVLEAGYTGTGLTQLYVGDVRTVDHVREGPDWKTIMHCGDGERAYRYARASESFAGGVTVGQVVTYCANSMGLALGNVATQSSKLSKVLQNGWTVHAAASSELDRILRSVGYSYSIQDGTLYVLAPDQSLPLQIPVISAQTGLIGSPEMGSPEKEGKPQSLKYRSLLLPGSMPGGRNQVLSERYSGIFRTRAVVHSGDVRGAEWYSDFDGIADTTAKAVSTTAVQA